MQEQPLILTLKLDLQSQAFFDAQRERYFPPERNFLKAHLTLFHQLPKESQNFLKDFHHERFFVAVTGLLSLGAGVAYRIDSPILKNLHHRLQKEFEPYLIPQDRQGFRPHITIQNKVNPAKAAELLNQLQQSFRPFEIGVIGLDLWTYLDGPWRHEKTFDFLTNKHPFFLQRQAKIKGRAFSRLTFCPNLPAVSLDDFITQIQADPKT